MRTPLSAVVLVFLAGALASQAQVASSPTQLLHPILKDPHHRNAPTSLNRDPAMLRDLNQSQAGIHPAAGPAKPAPIVARIDPDLAASKLTLIGTVDGLKGTIYVTNTGAQDITPLLELAVCNEKGIKIGSISKTGPTLTPDADAKIVLLATNLNATDLKLTRLTSAAGLINAGTK
jgi:hypothetical protein